MIIVNLKGGLGNQMFQYACGRALSLRTGDTELKLSTIGLDKANDVGDIYRPYSLSHFNIKAEIAKPEELERVANPYGIISKILRRIKSKYIYNFYIHFVPSVLNRRGEVYLDGYFQSEKYFKDCEETVRQDFTLKTPSAHVTLWKKEMEEEENSVSVHIRRGDYVGHSSLGGMITDNYYARAIKKITEMKKNPRFFVFSDDIEWVKGNMDFPESTVHVSSPDMENYEELTIMSLAKHNIIANSSFSWWGAWLNSNPDKIVICPAKWTLGPGGEKQTRDIIPQSWIKIEAR